MAIILKTETASDGVRYIKKFHLESDKAAVYFEASCLMSVRGIYPFAELYSKGNVLFLDTPSKEATERIGEALKKTIETTAILP